MSRPARLLVLLSLTLPACPEAREPEAPADPEVRVGVEAAPAARELPVPVVRAPQEGDLPAEEAFLAEINREMGFRDCFTVIDEPRLVPAHDAPRMQGHELVIGLDLGRVQVAYPTRLLNSHEIVEHTLEGLDLLVCW